MKISIKYKIFGLILILLVIIMAITGYVIVEQVKKSFLEEIKLRGLILTKSIAYSAEDPMIQNDDLYLAQLVKDALNHPGMIFAYILDEKKYSPVPPAFKIGDSIIFKKELFKKKITNLLPVHESSDTSAMIKLNGAPIFEIASPILVGGRKKIGEVHLGIDLSKLLATSRKIQMLIIYISIAGLIFGLVGAFLLGQYMVIPISKLVEGVHEIGKGNFDQEINVHTHDEIGELTMAFNQMAKDLKEKELIKDAFKRYVSHQVADEIIKNPDIFKNAMRGEKKTVTVLFGDIRGFTTMSEKLSPEEVVSILNYYLTEMTTIIFKNEGTIDKFIGDCIMAIFGAPIPHKDDVYRAVKSAVEIQYRMSDLNKERQRNGMRMVNVGIGINHGEAVVGNIGSKERLDYTVIGDSVNTASRIQGLAKGGEVVVSESVYYQVKDAFTFIEMPPVKVKGKEKPLKVFKIKVEGYVGY